MGNLATGNPWILDTAGVITTNPVTILKMEWKPNAAADSLEVRDNASQAVIWAKVALTGTPAGDEVWDSPEGGLRLHGFDLESVGTSCTLYVWVR